MQTYLTISPELLSVVLIATCIGFAFVTNFFGGPKVDEIPTADWLIRSFFWGENLNSRTVSVACIVWAGIACIFCFVVPGIANNGFVGTPFGSIVTINYAIVAPCLERFHKTRSHLGDSFLI